MTSSMEVEPSGGHSAAQLSGLLLGGVVGSGIIRGVVSRGVTAAAGQQSHDHGQGQQERKYFFHIEDYSFSYVCCSRDGLSINSRK